MLVARPWRVAANGFLRRNDGWAPARLLDCPTPRLPDSLRGAIIAGPRTDCVGTGRRGTMRLAVQSRRRAHGEVVVRRSSHETDRRETLRRAPRLSRPGLAVRRLSKAIHARARRRWR